MKIILKRQKMTINEIKIKSDSENEKDGDGSF